MPKTSPLGFRPASTPSSLLLPSPAESLGDAAAPLWSGFYKLPLHARQTLVASAFPQTFSAIRADEHSSSSGPMAGLEEQVADKMIENCIGTMGLPFGLALNLVIDCTPVVVPMAVEEPSVVAAVSGAAKTICSASTQGILTTSPQRNILVAQILLCDLENIEAVNLACQKLTAHKIDILRHANTFCVGMCKRGGGAVNIKLRPILRKPADASTEAFLASQANPNPHCSCDSSLRSCYCCGPSPPPVAPQWFIVVHILIDVCDSMGANCASGIAEGTSDLLAEISGARAAIRIVSNLAPERLTRAFFRIGVAKLAYKGFTGAHVAARIIEAYLWAREDVYRATTHNKGAMNGIDAVALATGQDWRAIESACHTWAGGKPITRYWMELDAGYENEHLQENGHEHEHECNATSSVLTTSINLGEKETANSNGCHGESRWMLCGELEAPIVVGTRGGVLSSSPQYAQALGIMGLPDSKRLAAIMCSVGLCQNFAALRALATEGIQRGHMELHAKNIAIAAGSTVERASLVARIMSERGKISAEAARNGVLSVQQNI